jgi:hypothetical protein
MLVNASSALAGTSPTDAGQLPAGLDTRSGLTQLAQIQPAPAPAPSPAQPGDEPVGNVATLTGIATVIRNKNSIALKLQDDIFKGDILQTSANSTLGVTFNDATSFNLTANARIAVDSFVYADGGKQNGALFDITRGTVAFVAAAVAKTGDMKISTPTATLGIRGTTGLVEVPEGASASNANNVAIKLYPDADGKVGRIEVNGRDGSRLGFLTQGASGFTIRPGAAGRFAAVPLQISPQQALRDQGIVRQVHAVQNVGRQIVTEKRNQRLLNPRGNNPAAIPPRPPGPAKQNGLPQRSGQQKQPGSPTPPAKLNQPGSQPQPGLPNRSGQQPLPQPQLQQPPGLQRQPNAPGVMRPALQKPKPVAPAAKGKRKKEEKR